MRSEREISTISDEHSVTDLVSCMGDIGMETIASWR